MKRSWRALFDRLRAGRQDRAAGLTGAAVRPAAPDGARPGAPVKAFQLDIAPNDPLLAYFLTAPGVVALDGLVMESPALRSMKDAGVRLVVPLVSQGELIGLLNLGPRRSEQDYSSDDYRLLHSLATQAAPALRVAQLARQQQLEARERERVEQEMQVARLIQRTLLPEAAPDLPGWRVAVHWQPARAVSGDFYDFLQLPGGRLGFIVADVTDKGVPAALVMATARSLLRSAAERSTSPGEVLQHANELLCPDMPPKMFVTCLYLVLDPAGGELVFANAGHNLPICWTAGGVRELRATGMPLGLLPGMRYEETSARLAPGELLLLYSDGLVEAHNPAGEMYGFPR
ncbi:MAG: PP2C family protein-serine/threonine phosphatase, partial [Chloroflexota bacterium]